MLQWVLRLCSDNAAHRGTAIALPEPPSDVDFQCAQHCCAGIQPTQLRLFERLSFEMASTCTPPKGSLSKDGLFMLTFPYIPRILWKPVIVKDFPQLGRPRSGPPLSLWRLSSMGYVGYRAMSQQKTFSVLKDCFLNCGSHFNE